MKRPGKVRRWLEELRKRSKLIGLEVVVEERASDPRSLLSMPWNPVFDERPTKHKIGFQIGKSVERWRPFWSIRYNLTSGRRVEPLRRLPVWDKPRVIAAISPGVYETMKPEQKQDLDKFVEVEITLPNSQGNQSFRSVAGKRSNGRAVYLGDPRLAVLGRYLSAPKNLRSRRLAQSPQVLCFLGKCR